MKNSARGYFKGIALGYFSASDVLSCQEKIQSIISLPTETRQLVSMKLGMKQFSPGELMAAHVSMPFR
jgi:hypothetical protein